MKSLAERHVDRAQRKVDNEAESTESNSGGALGAAAIAVAAAQSALAALTPEQRTELDVAMVGFEADDSRSIAEDENGNLLLAGIGTVNSAVVPAAKFVELSNTPVQQGKLPATSFDPANGNLNGQAIEAATEAAVTAGWVTPPTEEPVVEDKEPVEKPVKTK